MKLSTIKFFLTFSALFYCLNNSFAQVKTAKGCSQISPNRYGLTVINSIKNYKKCVQVDSLKLVRLDEILHPFNKAVHYSTTHNFTKTILYQNHQFYLSKKAATQLRLVQDSLLKLQLNIYLYDTYRPYAVTEKMWEIVPDDRYAANPANGSGHNRGVSIDLTIADAKTGIPLKMPTEYDNFTDSAGHAFTQLSKEVLRNRQMLKSIMEHFGFKALPTEWWHYSLPNATAYPLLNLNFKALKQLN